MNAQQKRFVDEYLIDLNASAAYQRAGYKSKGNAAEVNAHRLLRNDKISEAIQIKMKELSARTELSQDEVIAGLKKEALLTGRGSSHSARVRAWELLGKHIGMFPDRHEHTGKEGGEIVVRVKHDKSWYGNDRAHAFSSRASSASDTNAGESGPVQGDGVRPALGQNGHGLGNGDGRPRAGE